jgi:hypothetical protein
MIDDFTLRAGALVAAVAVVAGPWLVGKAKAAVSAVRGAVAASADTAQEAVNDDAHTVVEIARRLRRAGNTKGADLCKQLLDVMLSAEPKA